MRRIIAAVDGSDNARRALRVAEEIARGTGAKLTVAHVAPPPPAWTGSEEAVDWSEFTRAYDRYAEGLLADAEKGLDRSKLAVDTAVLRGHPAEALAEAATQPDVDLVVVGSRGLGTLARVLLGSVSDRLVHICPKPVLVVR